MSVRTILLLTVAAWMLPQSYACSQLQEHFRLLDEDGDGTLGGLEALLVGPFDTNEDGRVSSSEFAQGVKDRVAAKTRLWKEIVFERDVDLDGALSDAERVDFEYADDNHDGRITAEEFLRVTNPDDYALRLLGPQAFLEEAKRRFQLMDINHDARLSGTEMGFMSNFDINGDNRITPQEYTATLYSVAIAGNESPANPPPKPSNFQSPMQSVVDAINKRDAKSILKMSHPEFVKLVDPFLLGIYLDKISVIHGPLALPVASKIEESDGPLPGSKQQSILAKCERGELELNVVMLGERMIGLAIRSPEFDNVLQDLSKELIESDAALKKFADAYSPQCQQMIERILSREDDAAVAMFHPDVQQQVPKATFLAVFNKLRGIADDQSKVELEAAGVEPGDSPESWFLTLTHVVSGTRGSVSVIHKFQLLGFKAHLVAISVDTTTE